MPKNLYTFNFKALFRVILRPFLFFFFLESILTTAGWISLWQQEWYNRRVSGNYTIVCIGDSVTARGGENSYPNLLQSELNQKQKAIKFQVINKGYVGMTVEMLSPHFEGFFQQYHPQMVIFMLGLSDVQMIMTPENSQQRFEYLVLRKIKTYRLLKKLFKDVKEKSLNKVVPLYDGPQDNMPDPFLTGEKVITHLSPAYWHIVYYHSLTIKNYNDMVESALDKGAKVMVMQYALLALRPLQEIIAVKSDVTFVDNEKLFKTAVDQYGYDKFFKDVNGHFRPDGARLLVKNLSDLILSTTSPKM